MENLKELRESVRRNLVRTDMRLLDFLATSHNLINSLNINSCGKIGRRVENFVHSYNKLIENLNKKSTPVEDRIIELERKIDYIKNLKL